MRVVFPAPDGPMMQDSCPDRNRPEMLLRMVREAETQRAERYSVTALHLAPSTIGSRESRARTSNTCHTWVCMRMNSCTQANYMCTRTLQTRVVNFS